MTTPPGEHPPAEPAGPPPTLLPGRRPLIAALLSSLVPGLGQGYNGDRRGLVAFGLPVALLAILAGAILATASPTALAANLVVPATLITLLAVNLALLGWRLAAVGHAYLSGGPRLRGGRLGVAGIIGLTLIVAFTALPHVAAGYYGIVAVRAFDRIFAGFDEPFAFDNSTAAPGTPDPADSGLIVVPSTTPGPSPTPTPVPTPTPLDQRVTILLLGLDSGPGRNHELTDTMIVASLDPLVRTVSMISVPRDTVNVPLGDGRIFAGKINSLLSYATRNPAEFGERNPIRVLKDALGELVGVKIEYYAAVNLPGFIQAVDAVGGIDVFVERALYDGRYKEYGFNGFSIDAGCHHMNGQTALAYARIRKSLGESDFTRAARQQKVVVALRDRVVRKNLLLDVPALLDAVGNAVRTDVPPERIPELAAYAEQIDAGRVTNVVITYPLVRGGSNQYGSVLFPDSAAILSVGEALFPAPGVAPVAWPSPSPSPTPAATKSAKPGTTPKPTPQPTPTPSRAPTCP